MEKAKRIFKYIGIGLLALVSLLITVVLALGLWVYFKPAEAWRFAEKNLLPADLRITAEYADFDLDHIEKLTWDTQLTLRGLVVQKKDPLVDVSVDEVSFAMRAAFYPKIEFAVRKIAAKSEKKIAYTSGAQSTPAAAQTPGDYLDQIQSIIKMIADMQERAKFSEIAVHLGDLRLYSQEGQPIRASMLLNKSERSKGIDFDIQVRQLSQHIRDVGIKGNGDFALYESGEPFLVAEVSLDGPDLRSRIPFLLSQSAGTFSFSSDMDFKYRMDKNWLTLNPHIQSKASAKKLALNIRSDVVGIPGPISKLKSVRLRYELPLGGADWTENKGELFLSAPIPLFFISDKTHAALAKSCACTFANVLNLKINSDIWIARMLKPSKGHLPGLNAKIRADKIDNKLFKLDLGATLKMFREKDGWTFEPTLDSSAYVSSFQQLRLILRENRILVPAPFSVLDGWVSFDAKSPIEVKRLEGKFSSISARAKLKTDLRSKKQHVKFDSEVVIGATADLKNVDVDVIAHIDDFIVELPPLNPAAGMPSLVRDQRIQLKPKENPKPDAFKLTIGFRVDTRKKAGIKLLFPMAKPYIPITVKYLREEGKGEGFLQIEPFDIVYMRRKLSVDSLRLNLDETNDGAFPIDGKFHVKQTEYTVFIRVTGTTLSPKVDFSSEPYLERADIISVLLFDRTRDQLVGNDAETSGNVQAAMADRAVGLFGLWAFAATPIRSFSYNAVTKVYSATIVLGDGLTAGIGTSLDEYTAFEIRKRLSKRWAIAATWAPTDETEDTGQVVLQWEKRF